MAALWLNLQSWSKSKVKKDREELIKHIGTNNFNQQFKKKLIEQTERISRKAIRALLKGRATECLFDDYSPWDSRCKYEEDDSNKRINIAEKFDKSDIRLKGDYEHYFVFRYGSCIFLKLKSKNVKSNDGQPVHTEQERQWERNRRQLNKFAKEAYELRKEFVDSIKERKSFPNWQSLCIEFLLKKTCCFYGAELKLDYDWQREKGITGTTQEELEKFQEYYNEHAAGLLIWLIYNSTYDSAEQRFHNNWQWQHPKGVQNTRLSFIYEFLCAFGYEMSDEEKLWQDGKHPLQK